MSIDNFGIFYVLIRYLMIVLLVKKNKKIEYKLSGVLGILIIVLKD